MDNPEKEQILSNVISTQSLNDYDAVGALWKSLTRVVNLISGTSEIDCQGLHALSGKLSEEEMNRLLRDRSVDALIFLDPPLETLLADPEEKPDENSSMRIVAKLRSSRDSDIGESFVSLVEILKRICHKLPRDLKIESGIPVHEVILSARKILYLISVLAVSKLN